MGKTYTPRVGSYPGASWYDSTFYYRAIVLVDGVSGSTAAGNVDVNITIPVDWDEFWTNVNDTTNGYDIKALDTDGRTVLAYQLSGFNASTRTCTVQIQNFSLPESSQHGICYLTWGTGTTNDTTSFTPSSPITGYVDLSVPTIYRLTASQMPVGQDVPQQAIQVSANDVVKVALDITGILPLRATPYNGKYELHGPDVVAASVEAGGSGATATNADTRVVYGNGRLYVVAKFTGHSADGTDTGNIRVRLADESDLEFRFGIQTEAQVYA